MHFAIQMGFGMMDLATELHGHWGASIAILSPRDLEPEQVLKFGNRLSKLEGARSMLDPQFYLPHADHHRLCSHEFWPDEYQTGAFWHGRGLAKLLTLLDKIADNARLTDLIAPGLLAARIDADWIATLLAIAKASDALRSKRPVWMTLALGADVLRSEDEIGRLFDAMHTLDTQRIYLVPERPDASYFVGREDWMTNLLDVVAGLRLSGHEVIVGYCNQQMLSLALTGCSSIGSGTWQNVRGFVPDKFYEPESEVVRRNVRWYYCTKALSEIRATALKELRAASLLDDVRPPRNMLLDEVAVALDSNDPAAAMRQRLTFLHYLHCLRTQARIVTKSTFDETMDAYVKRLDIAERDTERLAERDFLPAQRDFRAGLGSVRTAISVLRQTRGPMLRRRWSELV